MNKFQNVLCNVSFSLITTYTKTYASIFQVNISYHIKGVVLEILKDLQGNIIAKHMH